MKYLVDANVLSEPTRPSPSSAVIAWLRKHERKLAIDPVILGEVRFGILLLPKGRRRANLEAWFDQGIRRMQCVPWDVESGLAWAELLARLRRSGRAMPVKDSMIASTAIAHGMTIVTRNAADFLHVGVPLLDPFDE